MAGELAHRGPDGVGLYTDGVFGMVNTRLSIIDLTGGDQPLSNEDGRYWVVQNGEIYNYPELAIELRSLGHELATQSDTEVLVHAFEEWGPRFLDRLNGEFSLAIYDTHTKHVFLARDRFGIRPLFIGDFGGEFVFASEVKALLRHPEAERAIDPYALIETFRLWSVLPDRSAFPGIRELPPGHYLHIDGSGARKCIRWWDLEFAPRVGSRTESVEALQEELLELLAEATRIRLRADVPVGVYLSGGMDSSAVAAMARRFSSGSLEAFSLSFEDPRFDESQFQVRMAQSLDVNLRTIQVSDADVGDAFPEVIRHAEKPILRTAPAPMLLLSSFVREAGFKVVLTGEGSDELLGGYNIFQEAMVRRFWARQPNSRLRPQLLGRLYPYLSRDLTAGGGFMADFFKEGITDLDDPLFSHRPRFKTTARNLRFLSEATLATQVGTYTPEERVIASLPPHFWAAGPLGQAQYLEIATFMTGYLLHAQGDRVLMANSVEGRFPFLDVHVAEFAASLPERLRLRDLKEKYLLRRSLRGVLPEEINTRPKRPYRAPITRAFFGPRAPEYVKELLDPGRLERTGLFNAANVTRLVNKAERFADMGLSESDEMGVVGILSTMLLDEQLVRRPNLAKSARATREVVGRTVVIDGGVRVS